MHSALFKQVLADDRGATAIEYGLIAALIVIAIISALQGFAGESSRIWTDISTSSANAIAAS